MHRMIFFVFKTLLVTVLSMFLVDITMTMISVLRLNNELEATAKLMQQSIMEENYLTDDAREVYNCILNGGTPNIPGYAGDAYTGITHDDGNGNRVIGANGLTGEGIPTEEIDISVKDELNNDVTEPQMYGEFVTLRLDVTIEPSVFWFNGRFAADSMGRGWYQINLEKEYVVPCLRYVKKTD